MISAAYQEIISSREADRRDLFLTAANRLGAPMGNIEKDFWVCWTSARLYDGRDGDQPRLLFKGGTSWSKAYGLIRRFSEDIDVTVFREDIGEAASVEELEELSGKQRNAKLDAIRNACSAYITGPLMATLGEKMEAAVNAQ